MTTYTGRTPRLDNFIFLSCCLHLLFFGLQAILPDESPKSPLEAPVKVTFVEAKKPPRKASILDTPIPKKIEKPKTYDFLSRTDSRAHSDLKKKKSPEIRDHKTVVPKAVASLAPARKPPAPPKKKILPRPVKKSPPPKKKKRYPLADRGIVRPELKPAPEPEPVTKPESKPPEPEPPAPVERGHVGLFDGFDPEKYASLDTQAPPSQDSGDDEPISLNTTETKYVSYFTRIKRQIERVWIYPLEAARRGISGQLTLRFQISRDGNLLLVGVVDESGYEILDFAAIKAVKGAAPFYPIPVTINKEKLTILATFIYSPTYGVP